MIRTALSLLAAFLLGASLTAARATGAGDEGRRRHADQCQRA